ncbi:uncharacterized protein F4812DRAFT_454950 [Daldinia caldariorum]|uniref:uncharacterized protein n=1 Tax=Daldinia caldariorum TaxID=326644 RepID=UPI002007491D|nr:uncharacterized protein F4812DRAFT_454950 [Daldinia caldariorum]KAI1473133.1 hypothetical protein F4812DRAFT_454950 [Daldinia caldariorum]
MSLIPRLDNDIQSEYVNNSLRDCRGQLGQSNQLDRSHLGQNDLSSQTSLTTEMPSFSSNVYTHAHTSPSLVKLTNSVPDIDSSQSSHTALARDGSWGSEAHSFPQLENINLQLATNDAAVSLTEVPVMRYSHVDLAVLNADQHDSGRSSKRPASKANLKANITVVPTSNASNSRKRGRKSTESEVEGPAEETKRSRGRPRLETKDQTPSERRRTQIRLAQRAYRNRKENAITDLQAKINDLQSVNNEINNAYQNLFNYASQRGLLAQAPEFGEELQKLQTLIKQTQEQGNPQIDDENESPEGHSGEDQREAQDLADGTATHGEPPVSAPEIDQTPALWGGITVSHEPAAQPQYAAISALDPMLNNTQTHSYEVITVPTLENASFGPNLSIDTNFLNPAYSSWAHHPWNRLTGPRTMSFNEWTFARRLHRHTAERAAALICMPHPPPARLRRVFGFVMLFETVDEIRSRTLAMLDREKNDPLSNWKYPFHRLGGSGTHFPNQEGPPSLSGSSTYQSSGFGTGPFNERTTRVGDTMLGVSQYINMSGWEGTWFDADEVEAYLAQNGVVIPTAADIHTVELHPGAFSDVHLQAHAQHMPHIPPNGIHIPHIDASITSQTSVTGPPILGGPTFTAGLDTTTITSANPPSGSNNPWAPNPASSGFYGGAQHMGGMASSFTGLDTMTANAFVDSSAYYFPGTEPEALTPRRVVLDINQFIGGKVISIP